MRKPKSKSAKSPSARKIFKVHPPHARQDHGIPTQIGPRQALGQKSRAAEHGARRQSLEGDALHDQPPP